LVRAAFVDGTQIANHQRQQEIRNKEDMTVKTHIKGCSLTNRLAVILGGLLLILALMAAPLWAQDNSNSVRALNARLLQLHGDVRSARGSEAAGIRSQSAAVIAERASALTSLMREDPRQALALAFSQDLLDDLKSKFPDSASQLEQHGVWEGTSTHVIFDDPARNAGAWSVHIRRGNESLEINSAAGEPRCSSGQTLTVEGIRLNNVVAAGSTSVQAADVAASGCSTTGVQNIAVLLVDFPGVPLPATVTAGSVSNIFFATSGRSVNTHWQEASYGQTSATGNVFGPYTLDRVYACSFPDYDLMRAAAFAAADADVYFPDYSRVFIVFPDPGIYGCWAGMGTLGCETYSTNDGSVTASVSWLRATYMDTIDQGVQIATHEGGHNLHLHHAASLEYGTEPLGNRGAFGSWGEYGDRFDTMGSWNFGQYNASHKARLGWLASGTNYQVVQSSGSFTIQPLETSPPGLQALKVQ
jgi:M6 family metalloprotease-like protein